MTTIQARRARRAARLRIIAAEETRLANAIKWLRSGKLTDRQVWALSGAAAAKSDHVAHHRKKLHDEWFYGQ